MTFEELLQQTIEQAVERAVKKVIDNARHYPEEWPVVLNQKQLAKALNINPATAKKLFNRADFPTVQFTETLRVVGAQALWDWLNKSDRGLNYEL